MSEEESRAKIKICLDDPETRATWESAQRSKREVERWPLWKRYGDAEERAAALRDFQTRWRSFMEGGWEEIVRRETNQVKTVRWHVLQMIPVHPETVRVSELVARIVDIEKIATVEQLFAAMILMSDHNHAVFAAGWAYRPPARVPRRGHCLRDMFLLFGYEPALETPDAEVDGGREP